MSIDWRRQPIIRLLSSLKFGVTILFLVLLYACVMSALPQVRGAVEMTEMMAFSHWLFVALIVVLMLSVTVATLVRIRFNLLNAGVLTVHAGILLLCGGALWYFGLKIEGDVRLDSPQLLLLSNSGQMRELARLLPEAGQNWSNNMPAFGGAVSLKILKTTPGANGVIDRATVQAQLGDTDPITIEVGPGMALKPLGTRLALQLLTFSPKREFYDRERPALYVRAATADGTIAKKHAEIRGLPLFRERYLDEGYTLSDSDGRQIPSKRTHPAIALGPISIPTGWFETWRMPIRIPFDELPFDVDITGYVPYVAGMASKATTGGTRVFPALDLQLAIPQTNEHIERTLFAASPAESIIDLPTPIEFRWVNSPQEREALLTPMLGADELWIEIKDPPISQRVVIKPKQVIEVEGTPYRITVQQLLPSWPLISPGFERAASPVAQVAVERGDLHFTRTVIQRFPALSQDIDEKGVRHKEGPYDSNLVLRYRTAANGWLMILADAESADKGRCEAALFDSNGRVDRHTLAINERHTFALPGTPLDVTVTQLIEKARTFELPIIETLERRRPNIMPGAASAIRLKFTGRGSLAGWSESQWCMFSDTPGADARSIQVSPPGAGRLWEFEYSRLPHQLQATLTPGKLAVKYFPGKRSVESWKSDFLVTRDGETRPTPASVFTNQTYSVGKWTLFQSGAAPDHWSYTVLGVGNRMGIGPMVTGCVMITLGCLYAFYVKPALRRRRQAHALVEAEARGRAPARQKQPALSVAQSES